MVSDAGGAAVRRDEVSERSLITGGSLASKVDILPTRRLVRRTKAPLVARMTATKGRNLRPALLALGLGGSEE
jgi:hypothetical protein